MDTRGVHWWALGLVCLMGPLLMGHHPGFPAPLDFEPIEAGDGEDWVLVATPGFISSTDATRLICKEAFGAQGDLYAAVMGTHHYAVDAGDGVAVTFDGCDVDRFHPIGDGWIIDLSARGDSHLAFAVGDTGGDQIYWSVDGGDTLEGVQAVDETLMVTAVDWFDDRHIVATAFEDDDFATRGDGYLMTIDIDSDQLDVVPIGDGLRFPYLMATGGGMIASAVRVDQRIELVWGPLDDVTRHRVELDVWPLRASMGDDNEVYVALFAVYAEWIGVAVATAEGLVIDPRLADRDARCVVADGDGLWICSSGFAEAYELWRVDDGYEPQPFYRLAYLEGARDDCPAGSAVAEVCPEQWEQLDGEIPQRPLELDDDSSGDDSSQGDSSGDEVQDPEGDQQPEGDGQSDHDDGGRCQTSGGGSPAGIALIALLLFFVGCHGCREVSVARRFRTMTCRRQ